MCFYMLLKSILTDRNHQLNNQFSNTEGESFYVMTNVNSEWGDESRIGVEDTEKVIQNVKKA